MNGLKKIVVVVDGKEVMLEDEKRLTVSTSTNANQPVALIVKDAEDRKIGEFSKWDYWRKIA